MFLFSEESIKRSFTPWGIEVKKRLLDKGLKQQDIVDELQHKGYAVNKITLTRYLSLKILLIRLFQF